MYWPSVVEIAHEQPALAATFLSGLGSIGMGTQTIKPAEKTPAQSLKETLSPGKSDRERSKKSLKNAIESGEDYQEAFKKYQGAESKYIAAKEIWKEIAQDELNDKYGVETKYADNLLRFLFKNKSDERIRIGKEMKYIRDVISQEQADGLRVAYKEQLEKRRSAEKILSQLGGQDFSKKHLKGDWSRYVK